MNTTTIEVKKPTKQLLDVLKENFDSKTYDDVIQTLIRKKTKSLYGSVSLPKNISLKQFLKDLRDERDRF